MARRSVARVDRKRLQPAKEASGDTPVLEHVTVHATEMVQASVMLITADKKERRGHQLRERKEEVTTLILRQSGSVWRHSAPGSSARYASRALASARSVSPSNLRVASPNSYSSGSWGRTMRTGKDEF